MNGQVLDTADKLAEACAEIYGRPVSEREMQMLDLIAYIIHRNEEITSLRLQLEEAHRINAQLNDVLERSSKLEPHRPERTDG